MCISWSQPENQPLLHGAWFLFLENGHRTQGLGAGDAHCYQSVSFSGLSQVTKSPVSFQKNYETWLVHHLQVCHKAWGLRNGTNYNPEPSFTRGPKSKPREGPSGTYVKSHGAQERVFVGFQGCPAFAGNDSDLSVCPVLEVQI